MFLCTYDEIDSYFFSTLLQTTSEKAAQKNLQGRDDTDEWDILFESDIDQSEPIENFLFEVQISHINSLVIPPRQSSRTFPSLHLFKELMKR